MDVLAAEQSPTEITQTAAHPLELLVCVDADRASSATRVATELAERAGGGAAATSLADTSSICQTLVTRARSGALPIVGLPLIDSLLMAGVDRVIGVGPNVAADHTIAARPVLVAMDSVVRTEPLIDAVVAFTTAATSRVVVAQVIPPTESHAGFTIGRESAKFADHIDPQVDAVVVSGTDVGATIAETARQVDAGLIIARSWHMRQPTAASAASHSLSIVAEAPCPVLIVK